MLSPRRSACSLRRTARAAALRAASDRRALVDAYRQVNRTLDFVHERNAEQSFFGIGREGVLTKLAETTE